MGLWQAIDISTEIEIKGWNGMASWKLCVEDYGKIKSAEMECAPLTLIVGDNNCGKSYLMSLLWGIKNIGAIYLFEKRDAEINEEERLLKDWISQQINLAFENGQSIVGMEDISDWCRAVINQRLSQNKDSLLKWIFNSEQVSANKIQIHLSNRAFKERKLCFIRTTDDNIIMKADYGKNKTDNYGIRNLEGKTDDHSAEFLMKSIFAFVLQINFGKNRYENLFLPAARTGFILTKDLVNQVGREQTFNMEPETKPMSPFTRPINQFLDVINVLSLENQPSAKRRKIIDLIEHQMTSGTIEISDSPNKEIRYVTETENGEQKSLPLRTVSAVVTELSPLILLLKHMENIESLCYEEPEMCLHPQLQHQMGRVMARIVNSGIDVIATTHSDILLQSINNKIALKSHPQKEDLCKKLQLEEEDLLLDTQVKVYQFQEHNGKSQLIEIPCGQNGFAVPTFNNALDDIMGEAYMVQGNSDE